jgi:hypothetical protein
MYLPGEQLISGSGLAMATFAVCTALSESGSRLSDRNTCTFRSDHIYLHIIS